MHQEPSEKSAPRTSSQVLQKKKTRFQMFSKNHVFSQKFFEDLTILGNFLGTIFLPVFCE